jgi:transposase
MNRINQEKKVTMKVLKEQGQGQREIARMLGVSEGSVRYHLRREGVPDGRADKPMKAEAVKEEIAAWMASRAASGLALHVDELCDHLRAERGYTGSYKSVWRYVRKHYPGPRRRPYRRVEMPAGAQAQVDWCERSVRIGGREVKAYGLMMVLSHSRAEALVWREGMNQMHWQEGHNACFERLGGVAATLRIDNLKTGMERPGVVNEAYERYARSVGFVVDGCPVRHPEAKGKVESRIAKLADALQLEKHAFADWTELQAHTDRRLGERSRTRICPATGRTVAESWRDEQALLRPVSDLPQPFELAVNRKVQKDCTVNVEGRAYSVPFALEGRVVEVRLGGSQVQVWVEGKRICEHPRGTSERVVINPDHYEGESTASHVAPLPIGRIGRHILELANAEVSPRAVDYYAALVEGRRAS